MACRLKTEGQFNKFTSDTNPGFSGIFFYLLCNGEAKCLLFGQKTIHVKEYLSFQV